MFECEGDGLPAPNVTWYKDNSLLRDFKPNILVYPDGVLEINPVEFSDFGTYYCQVENTERARSSRLAKLAQNGNTGQGSSKLIWLSWSQGMFILLFWFKSHTHFSGIAIWIFKLCTQIAKFEGHCQFEGQMFQQLRTKWIFLVEEYMLFQFYNIWWLDEWSVTPKNIGKKINGFTDTFPYWVKCWFISKFWCHFGKGNNSFFFNIK